MVVITAHDECNPSTIKTFIFHLLKNLLIDCKRVDALSVSVKCADQITDRHTYFLIMVLRWMSQALIDEEIFSALPCQLLYLLHRLWVFGEVFFPNRGYLNFWGICIVTNSIMTYHWSNEGWLYYYSFNYYAAFNNLQLLQLCWNCLRLIDFSMSNHWNILTVKFCTKGIFRNCQQHKVLSMHMYVQH